MDRFFQKWASSILQCVFYHLRHGREKMGQLGPVANFLGSETGPSFSIRPFLRKRNLRCLKHREKEGSTIKWAPCWRVTPGTSLLFTRRPCAVPAEPTPAASPPSHQYPRTPEASTHHCRIHPRSTTTRQNVNRHVKPSKPSFHGRLPRSTYTRSIMHARQSPSPCHSFVHCHTGTSRLVRPGCTATLT